MEGRIETSSVDGYAADSRTGTIRRPRHCMTLRTSIEKPIIGVVGFNLFTLLVFATAPVQWDTPNLAKLYLYVCLCQLLILIGFQLGHRKGLQEDATRLLTLSSGDKLTNRLFTFYICTFVVGYAYRMDLSPLDIGGMFSRLLGGVIDRRFGYTTALDHPYYGGPVRWIVYFAISIFNQLFFAVGFVQWRRLTATRKLLFAILVCLELFYWVGRGTAFGVVAMATTFWFSSMLWVRRSDHRSISASLGRFLLVFLLFLGAVAFFSHNLYSRSDYLERRPERYEFGKSPVNSDAIVFSIVPESLQSTYMNVVSYFGQGYYHTCLAFDLDFKSTWFLGSNPALISLAAVVGIDVWDDTYMHRLFQIDGIDEFGLWHSAYTWFASDVSFYGVPFVLTSIAYLFGFSWAKSVRGDFLSKIVFIVLGNVLLFLFANNSYLSSVFYSFMFVFPFWLYTRVWRFSRAARPSRRLTLTGAAIPGSCTGLETARHDVL